MSYVANDSVGQRQHNICTTAAVKCQAHFWFRAACIKDASMYPWSVQSLGNFLGTSLSQLLSSLVQSIIKYPEFPCSQNPRVYVSKGTCSHDQVQGANTSTGGYSDVVGQNSVSIERNNTLKFVLSKTRVQVVYVYVDCSCPKGANTSTGGYSDVFNVLFALYN